MASPMHIAAIVSLLLVLASAKAPAFPNVYAVVEQDPNFSTLKAVIDAGDVADFLKDPDYDGTVLAPTNSAFTALLRKSGLSLKQLLSDEALLQSILQYHALTVQVLAKSIPRFPKRLKPKTVGGNGLIFYATSKGILIQAYASTARIVKADITAPKAFVHVIDVVLIPPGIGDYTGCKSVADRLAGLGAFTNLLAAVKKVGLSAQLSDKEFDGTLFVPTDKAFATANISVSNIKVTDLAGLVMYHTSPVALSTRSFRNGLKIPTLLGKDTTILVSSNGGKYVASPTSAARIILGDVFTCRAVIHVINQVLTVPKTV